MNTSMIIPIPDRGSSQPLVSLYTEHYLECIQTQPCTLLFYEFYGIGELITLLPSGCTDFLIEEGTKGSFVNPCSSFQAIQCTPERRYFGVRFPAGMLPNRRFSGEFFSMGLSKLSSFEERLTWFSQNFCPEQQTVPPSEPVRYMLEQLCLSDGAVSVRRLSETLNYSERHIHRLFLGHMGFSPKHYSRIIRFQAALSKMLHAPGKSNSDLIKYLGYSDQAHFQREFKEFSGLTPRQFINLFLTTTLGTDRRLMPYCDRAVNGS